MDEDATTQALTDEAPSGPVVAAPGDDDVVVEDWDGEVAPDGGADDCTGEDGEDEGLEGVVASASARGWGPGWPHCQTDRLSTVVVGGGVRLAVRREIAPIVAALCAETVSRGYRLRSGQCWGFACRSIRGRNVASNHSWGLAVDLNSLANPMGSRLVTDMPSWLPALWRAHGFRWGGDYSGRKDAMHFEYVRTPRAAAESAARLRPAAKAAAKPAAKPAASPAPKQAPKQASGPAPKPAGKAPSATGAPRPAPPFPLPANHYFGVDRTPDCHTGRDPADRAHVRTLQSRLVERGWDLRPDGADGWFGKVTRQVVEDFQREKGLGADGRVGPRTWRALWQAPVTG
jgi:hypothetical protein